MTDPSGIRQRIDGAANLADVLDASYEAFEAMLSVIDGYHDAGGPFYAGLVMAAAAVADGRDALLSAPSLPLHSRDDIRTAGSAAGGAAGGGGVGPQSIDDPVKAAATVAGLSSSAALCLRRAAAEAESADDRAACLDAARYADEVLVLTRGNGP